MGRGEGVRIGLGVVVVVGLRVYKRGEGRRPAGPFDRAKLRAMEGGG